MLTANLYAQQTVTYETSTERIANPERGLYHYIETRASQPNSYSLNQLYGYQQNEDITLLYCINYLDAFVNAPISDTFLDHFEANMNTVREAGLKCILRFAYTSDYRNEQPPFGDATKAQILSHIEQLGPLLFKHADVIAVMQAGFIGVWGEWYYTDHFVDNPAIPWQISAAQQANRLEVADALLAHLPETHQVAVRYPSAKQGMLQRTTPILAEEAFENTQLARIGFHNDCFLAGDQDFGTYRDDADRDFLEAETKYVGLGGETCQHNPPRSSCENALQEFERFHWTYINTDYHPEVLDTWKNEGCLPEIEKKLGYRLVLKNGTYPVIAETGHTFSMQLSIENEGWAAPIKDRPLTLVAIDMESGKQYKAELPAQLQTWEAGSTINLDYAVCVSSAMPAGDYTMALSLPDPTISDQHQPNYAIRFANDKALWDADNGFNLLNHTISLQQGTENCAGPIILAPEGVATDADDHVLEATDFDWTLFPNPAKESIRISLASRQPESAKLSIEVFDMLGRRILKQQFAGVAGTKRTLDLPIASIIPGVYAIRVSADGRQSTKLVSIE